MGALRPPSPGDHELQEDGNIVFGTDVFPVPCSSAWPKGSLSRLPLPWLTYHPPSGPDAGRFPLTLTLDSLPTSSLPQRVIHTLKSVGETYIALLDLKMALLQANKDLISTGIKEFNVLLNQQVFTVPPISEEAMVTVVNDWVNFYINYYRQQLTGEEQEKDRALQELRQELNNMCTPFMAKYRAFLKSL